MKYRCGCGKFMRAERHIGYIKFVCDSCNNKIIVSRGNIKNGKDLCC